MTLIFISNQGRTEPGGRRWPPLLLRGGGGGGGRGWLGWPPRARARARTRPRERLRAARPSGCTHRRPSRGCSMRARAPCPQKKTQQRTEQEQLDLGRLHPLVLQHLPMDHLVLPHARARAA